MVLSEPDWSVVEVVVLSGPDWSVVEVVVPPGPDCSSPDVHGELPLYTKVDAGGLFKDTRGKDNSLHAVVLLS